MKRFTAVVITLFYTVTASATCAISGLSTFPTAKTIKQNSIFVLEGYGSSEDVILGLNKKHPIYLISGNKKIKLLVAEICVGQFFITQAILKPETLLEAGLEYTMHIDSLPEYESLGKFNNATRKFEPVTYKVAAGRDDEIPKLTTNVRELKKTLFYYGCGPSIHVVFNNPVKDNSEIIVKTIVKDLSTGTETTYYIEPDGGKIKVGHGMCAGAFRFDGDSNEYEVEFSFMDASGNLTKMNRERIKFTKPSKPTSHDEE